MTSLGSLHQAVDGSYIASISFQLDSIINPAASFFNVSLIAGKESRMMRIIWHFWNAKNNFKILTVISRQILSSHRSSVWYYPIENIPHILYCETSCIHFYIYNFEKCFDWHRYPDPENRRPTNAAEIPRQRIKTVNAWSKKNLLTGCKIFLRWFAPLPDCP